MRCFALFGACLLLTSCASLQNNYQGVLNKHGVSLPENRNFQNCRGYGCQFVDTLTLTDQDWKDIHTIFIPAPQTAEEERERIAEAIGLFERKVGPLNGTEEDINGTFKKTGYRQHDCTDESINSTTYLVLLSQEGLIQHHTVQAPTSRLPLIDRGVAWPHKTAVIQNIETGERFAIDSWFHDNGKTAEVLPLDEWRDGWRPPKDKNKS